MLQPRAVPRGSNRSGLGLTRQRLPTLPAGPTTVRAQRGPCSAPSPFSRTVPLTLKGSGNVPSHKYKPPHATCQCQNLHTAPEGGIQGSVLPTAPSRFPSHGFPPPRTGFGDFCVSWRLHLGFLSPVAVDKEVAGGASYSGLSFLTPTCPRTADIFWRNIPVSASTEMRLRCHAEKHPEKNTPHTQVM